ncbi:hypothetical protein FDUTEX481_08500 [Tolypothrix sp. PCC 7601]|nr:hypothetical protein FDUTEX481_08500 [Tolypothrix sp. PCC 7601]
MRSLPNDRFHFIATEVNTCRLRAKGEEEKGQEKTFNPYPFTFSPNQILS